MKKLQKLRLFKRQQGIKEYIKLIPFIWQCIDTISRQLLSHTKNNSYEACRNWVFSKTNNQHLKFASKS